MLENFKNDFLLLKIKKLFLNQMIKQTFNIFLTIKYNYKF